ncbi:SusC/RagA family TonB-linked outer membrane protein [Mucilaginibacter daejeonensis]|uniref:SusC/RagA family TonB-linked outer membrane protein n=1 Tax=Mucilaginibacter daejeonensis TaxID=398049 RepID=UPI001D17C4B2|nr:SusC/RagA family TonB-linked outer membrane protein [Mucilaginibacter daejeonensis]UEG54984.1 SusC/RagA family TonB-linked outer membrane protein [Mucilaginibacter daejeonensis]
MISLLSVRSRAQTMPVKGKVTDAATGEALIGVTVKASAGGAAATDLNGMFTVNADPKGSLTFTYTGYTANTVNIGGQSTVNVKLTASNRQLTDVVVVGYGTQKRKDLTGSIASVKIEGGPKESVPYVNALEAIQGTPGVNVGPSTGAGVTPNILVRGQNSISANTNPLILLDGVIFNGDLNQINMNDIATYDVLKDAASTSIYGSRSQNGVISITTKRGRSDKPLINFNAYYGRQSWTRVPKMRQGDDYIQWRRDLAAARGAATDINSVFGQTPYILRAINSGQTINWLEDIQQPAPIQSYDVSVSGRSEKTNYYFSAGYINQKGVLYNDKFSKPNITLKVDNNITDWLTVGVNGYYSSRDYSGIPSDLYMATYLSPYSYKYADNRPDLLQRYPEGLASNYNPYWGNPSTSTLGSVDDNMEKYSSIRGTGFVTVKFPFVKGLSYRLNVNGERSTVNIANFHHEQYEVNTLLASDIANPTQFLSRAYGNKTSATTTTYLFDNLLSYTRNFSGHQIDALVGYTRDNTVTETLIGNGNDYGAFGSTVLGYYGLQSATTQRVTSRYLQVSNIAYIGRLSYNYKGKYYGQVSFNRGGYSAFAPGKKFGNFPGASIAWVPTEEEFMKNVSWLNNLKIRASYGQTGNQGVSPYATQATVATTVGSANYPSPGYTVFGGTSYQYSFPSQLGNQNLTWEKTAAVNLALDFSVLKNRLSGTIDVYRSKTTDLLYTLALSPVNGFPSALTNIGQVNNKGIEVSLNSVNMSTPGGFRWESGFAFWLNRNKLVKLTGIINPATGKENDDTGNSLFIGKSLGAIYDYTVDGIVQTSDAAYIAANTGVVPGDVKFKDINGDGKITSADRSVIGYSKENYNMNLSNTLTYKNFQLYFSINAIIGGGKDNFYMSTNLRSLNPGAVQIGNWLNLPYWTPTNPNNEYPRANYNNPLGYGFYQERTFARLQNLAFSYLFPKKMLDRIKVSNLKLYVSGTNLFTATKWIGLDPANGAQIGGNGGSTNTSVNQSTPILRAITFGLNAGF